MSDDDDFSQEDRLMVQSVTAPDEKTRFDVDCQRVFIQGAKSIPGFEHSVKQLKQAEVSTPDFLLQLLETDHPDKVLHQLGQDIDTAKKVAALPPVKRAAALAAIERGEPLPEPRMPVWKTPKAMRHEDEMSDAEWSRWYDKNHGVGGLPGRRR